MILTEISSRPNIWEKSKTIIRIETKVYLICPPGQWCIEARA